MQVIQCPKISLKKIVYIVLCSFLIFSGFAAGISAAELTEEEAKKLIQDVVKHEDKVESLERYQQHGNFYYIGSDEKTVEKYRRLEEAGYVKLKLISGKDLEKGLDSAYAVEFTEKAAPFLIKPEGGSEDRIYINLAKIDNLDVTGVKRTAQKEYKAEVMLGYKVTPFGEVLLGRGVKLDRKEDASFEAQDDGWRVKFKINF
ncbi:MAG: hypothetical protein A4E64_00365 [Syntrophorhabdus sp. PtaU1.Bin058]|nr:MAG: hypothetical protein A4E64_00365 [Syntrophorhabdus sp. PtaU1.Bin058]